MAEYIEREAVISRLNKVCVTDDVFGMGMQTGIEHAINCTKEAPTADVVEVVRCKDCEHYIEYPLSERAKEIALWGKCNKNKHLVYPTDFCSYGKRKEVKDA